MRVMMQQTLSKVYARVEVPMNDVIFLKFAGLVFDTGLIFEDQLEDRRWTCLDKIYKYFYETIRGLLGNKGRPYIPFK